MNVRIITEEEKMSNLSVGSSRSPSDKTKPITLDSKKRRVDPSFIKGQVKKPPKAKKKTSTKQTPEGQKRIAEYKALLAGKQGRDKVGVIRIEKGSYVVGKIPKPRVYYFIPRGDTSFVTKRAMVWRGFQGRFISKIADATKKTPFK